MIGYMPPRELVFNHKGELVLFELKSTVNRRKRVRQLPFILSAGLFTYLMVINMNTFTFATAGVGTYLKLLSYWLLGWSPSVYIINLLGRVSRMDLFKQYFYRKNHRRDEITRKWIRGQVYNS